MVLTSTVFLLIPRKSRVSVEYGLCEMLNSRAIKPNVAPKDEIFGFDISKCEAELPAGSVDNSVEQIYKVISITMTLVSGEGVASSVHSFVKDVDKICEVEYCANSHLRRPIFFGEYNSFTAGDLVGSPEGQVGITYLLFNKESSNPKQNSN